MNPEKDVETLVGARPDIRIERILCPVDPSDVSAMAYRYAQSIAAHYHASLIVQKVIEYSQYVFASYTPSMPAFVEFSESLVADGLAALHRFVDGSGGTIQPECIVQANFSAADAILSLAETRAISLIVMGTHGRRGFDRLMMGSVTERVLRHASCPVLAVRPAAPGSNYPGAPDEPVPIRRILCCVDFSAHSRRALEYALSAADAYSADVTVLHVLDPVSQSADVAQETDAAMANLAKLLPPGSSSTKTHLEVRLGEAYREILDLGSEMQADLVVTGVRGRNSLDLAVFGSTTYRVIQLGPGPVLTVPV
ncbi:MAG TPA: universal stress protein [Bryobacteraceae bacterium]|nr:universal stress protein [Bryobacteraceae bacterium]